MEQEAYEYYAEYYPHINYLGFRGFATSFSYLEDRSEQPFYYPIHFIEPIPGNEAAIDLDYYSHISPRQTLETALELQSPAVTDRLGLVSIGDQKTRCEAAEDSSYGVVLMHPEYPLSTDTNNETLEELASLVICIPSLLIKATEEENIQSLVYIFDSTDSSNVDPVFLG